MSDDFGTVNIRRGDRAREIEILRQQYRRHRETLSTLAADAPTEHLAGEYARMIHDIDQAMRKLDELEGANLAQDTQPAMRPETARRTTAAGAGAAAAAVNDAAFRNHPTEPGGRRLVTGPPVEEREAEGPSSPVSRLVLIIAAGIVVLAIIGWLLWHASGDRREAKIVREPDTVTTVTETTASVIPVPQPAPEVLAVTPPAQDYGAIRKGTRAVRQFQITNTTAAPITIQVARSQCRCLYYDYAEKLAPGKKETITVTIDGAKAKSGLLHETLTVASKTDKALSATFDINAEIK